MKLNFFKKSPAQDWLKFFGELPPATRKAKLIEVCQRDDVSIYMDDPVENAHTPLRAVASEAELERRILVKKSVMYALHSRWIAAAALFVSVCALALEIYDKWKG